MTINLNVILNEFESVSNNRSISEFALYCNIPQRTMYRLFESGVCSVKTASKISRALSIPMYLLVG